MSSLSPTSAPACLGNTAQLATAALDVLLRPRSRCARASPTACAQDQARLRSRARNFGSSPVRASAALARAWLTVFRLRPRSLGPPVDWSLPPADAQDMPLIDPGGSRPVSLLEPQMRNWSVNAMPRSSITPRPPRLGDPLQWALAPNARRARPSPAGPRAAHQPRPRHTAADVVNDGAATALSPRFRPGTWRPYQYPGDHSMPRPTPRSGRTHARMVCRYPRRRTAFAARRPGPAWRRSRTGVHDLITVEAAQRSIALAARSGAGQHPPQQTSSCRSTGRTARQDHDPRQVGAHDHASNCERATS